MTNLRNMVMSSKFKGFQKTRESRKQTDAALRIKAPPIARAEARRLKETKELADWTKLERKTAEVFDRNDYMDDEVGVNRCIVDKIQENEIHLHFAGSKCNIEIDNILMMHNMNIRGLNLLIVGWNGRNYDTFYGIDFANIVFRDCDIRNLDLLHLSSADYVHLRGCNKITATGYAWLNRTSRLLAASLSRICDDDLVHLCNVRDLNISHSFITDIGFKNIKTVRTLSLTHCPFVSSNGLACLEQCFYLTIKHCPKISIRPKNPELRYAEIAGVEVE